VSGVSCRKVGSKTAFAEITERISQRAARPPDLGTVSQLRSASVGTNSDAASLRALELLLLLTNIVFPLGCPVGLVLFLTANADKTGPTESQGRTERSEGGRPERGAASAKWLFVWRAVGAFANDWKRLAFEPSA
jgi:hypothetical protein